MTALLLLYIAAQFAALLRCVSNGYASRFPCFCAFLGLQTLAAMVWLGAVPTPARLGSSRISVDYDQLATVYGWGPIEALSVIAAVAAAAEIQARIKEKTGPAWFALMIAVGLILNVTPVSGDWETFLAIRETTWIFLAILLVAVWLYAILWRVGLDPMLRRHAALFTVLMLAHAFIAPMMRWGFAPTWFSAQVAYRLVAVGCCLGWVTARNELIVLVHPSFQPDQPSLMPFDRSQERRKIGLGE